MSGRENIDAFRWRTRGFMSDSLYDKNHFGTAGGLKNKVSAEGRITPFYGNTIIFEMSDADKEWLVEIQKKLYLAADGWAVQHERGGFLADPLRKDTFHITLHDLLNSPHYDDVALPALAMQPRAEAKLRDIRARYPEKLYLRPVFLFNMMNTSVVLGFEPCSEADCDMLMALYDEFQTDEFRPLDYPLTPHVTMAYYCPDDEGYGADMVSALQNVFTEVNFSLGRRVVELQMRDLHHRFFNDMNHYMPELIRID